MKKGNVTLKRSATFKLTFFLISNNRNEAVHIKICVKNIIFARTGTHLRGQTFLFLSFPTNIATLSMKYFGGTEHQFSSMFHDAQIQ